MILLEFKQHVSRLFTKFAGDFTQRCLHAAVGISGEAGETIDAVKKHWVYGKELDKPNILEEAGDILFYTQALLTECGYTLEDAMRHNITKLNKRYPEGYTDQAAQERADKKEETEPTSEFCDE